MREIKFKYYFLLNKIVVNTKCFIIEDIEDINFNTVLFLNVDLTKDNFENMELYRSEYTGLKDKNGVEIYEGDILSHHLQGNRFVEYGSLFKNYGGYMLVSKNGMRGTLNDTIRLYEVIGNIYENKDLLE